MSSDAQAAHSPVPATPLQTLLDHIRAAARSATDTGSAFETLCIRYLTVEPKYRRLFASVQPWRDWAAQHGQALGLTPGDKGIDLVATTHDGERYAVQCKCYAPDHVVSKADIDSFLAASGHQAFAERLIIDTTRKRLGGNADEMFKHQRVPVTRVSLEDLEASGIDWARYRIETPHTRVVEARSQYGAGGVALKPGHRARAHQQQAIDAVLAGLKTADRGKLIMACGTGKTFTALKIAETLAGPGKTVLFLVPSLALLSQTLTEWSQQSAVPITAFAVCSDSEVGKRKGQNDDNDSIQMALHELAYPATTHAASLARQAAARHTNDAMTVVFSTYHSLDVIHQAQQQCRLPAFDLAICDEAHRTTGQTWEGDDESHFVRIHDNAVIQAGKRLYMTATPRIYSAEAREKSAQDLMLYSMDDAAVYGNTLHTLSFSAAVEQNLLVPYKVIVLTVQESDISERLQRLLTDADNSLRMDDAARIIGCFKALAKQGLTDLTDDPAPMRRAVAFCQIIDRERNLNLRKGNKVAARQIADMFEAVVQEYQRTASAADVQMEDRAMRLRCEAQHVHGAMGAAEKSARLAWLKDDADAQTCRILTNVRCLSEGVDVPALDAVLFLTPRNSQIEVVQSVGRVMRCAPGKTRGYIILPVVIPSGVEPHRALNDNKTYQVVWQVLKALKSHDDEFDRFINRIELLGSDPQRIEIVAVTGLARRPERPGEDEALREARKRREDAHRAQGGASIGAPESTPQIQEPLRFQTGELERAILAKVVEKMADRDHWEQWAADIARIAHIQQARIRRMLQDPQASQARAAFDGFTAQLHAHLNTSIAPDEIIEMLAQHLITKPVFDALFGSSDFTRHNPISAALQTITDVLLEDVAMDKERQSLESFYADVRRRTQGIDDPVARQTLIVTLYDQFFAQAFPRIVQKHGIVYTPVEIVDFILKSVAHLLQTCFGKTLADEDVQVLDPFTGTGTFMARLLSSGLIPPEHLPQVYQRQLHATEILLLPYYIAAVNIESTFAQLCPQEPYTPFPGILLADTFNIPTEKTETLLENKNDALAENNARRRRQMESKITVIVGNPPYSVGQKSQNHNNQNVAYPALDQRIEGTYAKQSRAALKKGLYDSYIRAIRWASDRIDKEEGGIIGFVTNAGWLDSAATAGLRKCLVQEFSSLYVFHLRGNQRTQGEQSRKEGGKVFGSGSRAPIAISILVKQPHHSEQTGQIYFCDIGDYLSREEKLQKIAEFGSIAGIEVQDVWQSITPDEHGDWLNQRQDGFSALLPMGDAKNKNKPGNAGMFENFSLGVNTSRDPWCNNPSRTELLRNTKRLADYYEVQRAAFVQAFPDPKQRQAHVTGFIDTDPMKISWSSRLLVGFTRNELLTFHSDSAIPTLYRPFSKGWLYYDSMLNDRRGQMPQIFPLPRNGTERNGTERLYHWNCFRAYRKSKQQKKIASLPFPPSVQKLFLH